MVSAVLLCMVMLAVTSVAVSSQYVSESEVFDPEPPVAEKRTFKHKKPLKLLPLLKKHKKFGLFVPHVFAKTHYAEVPVIREPPIRHVPETIIESSPLVHEYAPSFSYEHHFTPSPNVILFPVSDRPAFPLPPVYAPVPAPQLSFLPSIAFPPPASAPTLPTIAIARPAPVVPSIAPPQPSPTVITPVPPAPVFSSIAVKIPSSSLPPVLPSPTPAPPLPVFHPAPPTVSIVPAFPGLSAPTPAPVVVVPSPAPTLSIPATSQPAFPYPPSGSPVPSYIKDVSMPVTEPPTNSIVTPTYDQIQDFQPIVKPELGFFHRLKDWKADKATAAFNHFAAFRRPQIPVVVPTVPPPFPSLQIPVPFRPLPLTPDRRPPPLFFQQPLKYESFPPNSSPEAPPSLFNSYGAPIPHDSYAAPNDRLSPDASEEELAVLPAPPSFGETQRPSEFLKDHPVYVPENENVSDNNDAPKETKAEEQTQQRQEEETAPRNEDPNIQNHRLP